jgi:hypothetical protein
LPVKAVPLGQIRGSVVDLVYCQEFVYNKDFLFLRPIFDWFYGKGSSAQECHSTRFYASMVKLDLIFRNSFSISNRNAGSAVIR